MLNNFKVYHGYFEYYCLCLWLMFQSCTWAGVVHFRIPLWSVAQTAVEITELFLCPFGLARLCITDKSVWILGGIPYLSSSLKVLLFWLCLVLWVNHLGMSLSFIHRFKGFVSLAPSLGEGNGTPLRFSCLENPRDGGAWWAAIYGVTQSRTGLMRLSSGALLRVISLAL